VDASFRFPNAGNPWATQFPEVTNLNDLSADVRTDFIAVKIGDVNGNALTGVSPRQEGTFYLKAQEGVLKTGQVHRVALSGDFSSIEGLQFTLGYDRNVVELVDVEYGIAKENHFGVFTREGILTASWEGTASSGVLATLVLRAKADGRLSEVLNVNSRYTRAEAYGRQGAELGVSLDFGGADLTPKGFDLLQNIPNPFAGETLIGFVLPQGGDATLKVSDIQGRVIRVIKGQYNAGYNSVMLRGDDLPSGVLQYTLTSGEFTATRRMIIGK
jgi:hypothetical protein